MPAVPTLECERVRLRDWCDEDLAPFAALNADPEVMRYFPARLSREQSDAQARRIRAQLRARGFGLWACEPLDEEGRFMGFVGLSIPDFDAPFTPCTEIGWRLARPWWGRGLATEAARAAAAFAFETLDLEEIVSFTATNNRASRRVMEKLGMRHEACEDFDHPRVPHDHPLRRHVLYRLTRGAMAMDRLHAIR